MNITPPQPGEQFDVFLSYHSGDSAWVVELKNALKRKGMRVWLDKEQIRPGDLFVNALEMAIQSCGSVAIIVSAAALRSPWVQEEYNRALTLANSYDHTLRLIPILLEGTQLPGFLASREWVDFTDPTHFDRGVERLVWGISGCHSEQTAALVRKTELPVLHSLPSERALEGEVGYLEREIQRNKQAVQRLRLTRWCPPLLGLILAYAAASTTGLPRFTIVAMTVGASLVIALIAVAATAKNLASSEVKLAGLVHLKDGMELCRTVKGPGCNQLESTFWQFVQSPG